MFLAVIDDDDDDEDDDDQDDDAGVVPGGSISCISSWEGARVLFRDIAGINSETFFWLTGRNDFPRAGVISPSKEYWEILSQSSEVTDPGFSSYTSDVYDVSDASSNIAGVGLCKISVFDRRSSCLLLFAATNRPCVSLCLSGLPFVGVSIAAGKVAGSESNGTRNPFLRGLTSFMSSTTDSFASLSA